VNVKKGVAFMNDSKNRFKGIGDQYPTFIIAEIGGNHQGDLKIAKQLIDAAAAAAVDAVKFQKRSIGQLMTKALYYQEYQTPNSFGKTYGEHRAAIELTYENYYELKQYAENRGLIFFASPWDAESVDFLEELNIELYKIASADLTNIPLLQYIIATKKPIILSTGMSYLSEIDYAVKMLKTNNSDFALLQCTSTYPVDYSQLNLKVIPMFKERYHCIVGYSGHEQDIFISVGAVALGAKVIERHLSLDRTWKGSDHKASLEPDMFKALVANIRRLEQALESDAKIVFPAELPNREKLAKSLTTRCKIPQNSVITREMLAAKSPGNGICPLDMDKIVGKRARRLLDADETLCDQDVM
jgi:sialic acid synthase